MVDVVDEGIIPDGIVEDADAAVRPELRRADRYEGRFIDQPSDRGVRVLGQVYADAYRALIEHQRAGGTVPEDIPMDQLWMASVVPRSGLSSVDVVVDNIRTSIISRGENVFDPDRVGDRPVDVFGPAEVWRHSFYQFGFMTWSDAVWRLDTDLQKYNGDTVDPLVQLRPLE